MNNEGHCFSFFNAINLNRYLELIYMRNIRYFWMVFSLNLLASCSDDEKESIDSVALQTSESQEIKQKNHPGKALYMQFCLSCHMENGSGVPGLYPPLIKTEMVLNDNRKLIKTVLHGQEGPITVSGEDYNSIMAKFDYLNDEQVANVLNYIRTNFGNDAVAITVNDVRTVRTAGVD